jgi:UPF0176 protein
MNAENLHGARPYRVLLYYKYVPIYDYESFAREHLAFCESLGLKGRIIVAPEGINGTVSGTPEQTDAYIADMRADSRFEDMWFKVDEADAHSFKKMHVRAKAEIVTWRFDVEIDPNERTGEYLTPEEFRRAMEREDVVILDGRNSYEYDLGHFEGAIRPEVESSREFPAWIRENFSQYKDKTVLTYCTGGIRCEKLSAFLLHEGFQRVAQLHGGIVHYAKDPAARGKGFVGRCYVFDERISVPVDAEADADAMPEYCLNCGKPADNRVHCSRLPSCEFRSSRQASEKNPTAR